jgi:hypothetical protein
MEADNTGMAIANIFLHRRYPVKLWAWASIQNAHEGTPF